jgi:hypothetical protein
MTLRLVGRWAVLIVGVVACAPLVRDAARNYHEWRTTTNDPSAKDAYLTFLEGDIVLLVLVIAASALGFWLIGRGARSPAVPLNSEDDPPTRLD